MINQNHSSRNKREKSIAHSRSNTTAQETASSHLATHLATSFGITILIGMLLLLVCTAIAYFCPDPNATVQVFGLIASALTALFGGFTSIKLHKHSALFCGLLNGLLVSAFMLLLSLFFAKYASGYSAGISCLLHMIFLVFSVLGAYLGLPKSSSKKKKKRL